MSELTDLQSRLKVLNIQRSHLRDEIYRLQVELTDVELERYDVLDDIEALEAATYADEPDTADTSK